MMRRKIITLVFIGTVIIGLVACKRSENGDVSKDKTENKAAIETLNVEEQNVRFYLKQTSELKSSFSIPNPEKAKGTAEVILHKCEYKEGQNNLYCVERENEPTYDLSFLGLKNKVYVTNFAIGNITGDGECLVLALEERNDKNSPENYAYLAVLDYKNKKSYLVKTDIIAGQGRDEQLNLQDITGDGREEVIFSSEPNTTVDWNLYQFVENDLKKIYSNNERSELERDGFQIKLVDNYKMQIIGRKFDFDQTISLIDLGYQKSDLEYSNPNNLDKSDNVGRRAYKNGKLMKKDKNSLWTIEIQALMADNWDKGYAEYNYFREIDNEKGICIPLRVVLGDEEIGKLNVYLKYDVEMGVMKIAQAEFVDYK